MNGGVEVSKKAGPKKKSEPKAAPEPDRVRSAQVLIRCRPEFKAWLERLAEHDRGAALVELADRAFVAYARAIGFGEAAPPR